MMDATPLARSAIHFLTDSELSEKSIVRAFGGFAAPLSCCCQRRRRLSTSMSGVMKCRMENVQLSRGGQFSIFREECTLTASIHLRSPHDDVDDDANISELCELQNVVQRGKVDVQRQ